MLILKKKHIDNKKFEKLHSMQKKQLITMYMYPVYPVQK